MSVSVESMIKLMREANMRAPREDLGILGTQSNHIRFSDLEFGDMTYFSIDGVRQPASIVGFRGGSDDCDKNAVTLFGHVSQKRLRVSVEKLEGCMFERMIHSPLRYYDTQGKDYPNSVYPRSYTSVEVLEFLRGQPWDDIALNWVHSLRPSMIRVVTGAETSDAKTWRVTVCVDESNIIRSIRQEVEVRIEGCEHGHDLQVKTQQRKRGVQQ